MTMFVYRGYDIKTGASGRFHIYKGEVEVYSMTATLDDVHDWIDRAIRKSRAG